MEGHGLGQLKCPICQSDQWELAQHFLTPIIVSPDAGLSLGNVAYPHLLLTSPCGYAMFFNAMLAGVYKAEGNPHG